MNSNDRKVECECNKKHIKGVHCDVHNCIHNENDCYCTAEQIAVGPHNATSSYDTVCATFKEKKL